MCPTDRHTVEWVEASAGEGDPGVRYLASIMAGEVEEVYCQPCNTQSGTWFPVLEVLGDNDWPEVMRLAGRALAEDREQQQPQPEAADRE